MIISALSRWINARNEKKRLIEAAAQEDARHRLGTLGLNVKMPCGKIVNLRDCRLVLWRACEAEQYFDYHTGHPPRQICIGIYLTGTQELVSVALEGNEPSVSTGRGGLYMVRSFFSMAALTRVAPDYPIPANA